MSRRDLRSFQQEISERLVAARRATGDAPRLAFVAGDARMALPLAEVSEVAPVDAIHRVPGTHNWFLGLTNVRGAVISLTHLGALTSSIAPSIGPNARVMVLGGPYARLRAGLLVDSVVGLRKMNLTTTGEVGQSWFSGSAADEQGTTWRLLNIAALVEVTGFLKVEAA